MEYSQAEIHSKMNIILNKIEENKEKREAINKELKNLNKELKNLEQLKKQYKLF